MRIGREVFWQVQELEKREEGGKTSLEMGRMSRPEEKKAKKKLPMVKNLRSKEVSYSNLSALLHCSMVTHCNPQFFRKSLLYTK